MKSLLVPMTDMFNDSSKSANEIWLFYKSALHKGVQEHIPQKRSRRRNKHPWIGEIQGQHAYSEIQRTLERGTESTTECILKVHRRKCDSQ